jgi:DNA invertase Pin-like site-specific DNA recombinase
MPKPADTTKPLALYVRVSRVNGREGERFISPEIQRRDGEQYAVSRGFRVASDRFDDLDVSGATPLDDRSALAEALRRVESGELGGIVAATQCRLARNVPILRDLRERLKRASAVLLVADNPAIEDAEAEGYAALPTELRAAFDEALRGEAKKRFKVARRQAVARGIHVASRTPTGYLKGDDRRLVPDPVAAPIVAEAFRRRAAGESLKRLAAFFNEAGIIGPYGSPNWTACSLSKVLRNRAYRGEARSGEFVNLTAHPAVVTEAEWQGAQSPRPSSTPRGEGSVLGGLLRCAGCGYLMKADKMTDPRSGERVRIYRCRGDHAAGKCEARASVMGRVIEPFVAEALLASGRFTLQVVFADEVDSEALLREVEVARSDFDEYVASDLAGVIGAARFREEVERRKARLDEAKAALAAAGAATADEIERETDGKDTVRGARALWYGHHPDDSIVPVELRGQPLLSTEQRRQILSSLFDVIVVGRGRMSIAERTRLFWRGEGPKDLPGRGKRVGLRPIAVDSAAGREGEPNAVALPTIPTRDVDVTPPTPARQVA